VADGEEYSIIGLISLKDIFEEILESKLYDDDVHINVDSNIRTPGIKHSQLEANVG